jgi:mycothiol synthase
MSTTDADLDRVLELTKSQRPDPKGWSLAIDRGWLRQAFFRLGVTSLLQERSDGRLGGCAFVCGPAPEGSGPITVASMLLPGDEHLWPEQLEWIEERIAGAARAPTQVVSENLTDAETLRWAAAGYDLVFEELAMECSLTGDLPPVRWPPRTVILEWEAGAASASFEVYEAAFRSRPGFPGLSQSEWIGRLTSEEGFLPTASFCAVRDGTPIGFVVCGTGWISGTGWIGQVGVDPECRRMGLATALVTEARARMHALGIGVAYLHVNRNNPAGLATWEHLGWRECGRRGRFGRAVASDAADTI